VPSGTFLVKYTFDNDNGADSSGNGLNLPAAPQIRKVVTGLMHNQRPSISSSSRILLVQVPAIWWRTSRSAFLPN